MQPAGVIMWAACCNWFCIDAETEGVSQNARTPDRPNENIRTSPPVSETTCAACGIRMQSTSRKIPCLDCRNNFCTTCVAQLHDGLCELCRRIRSTSFTREELLKLKVKDLRDYLSMRDVPTDLCREKEDLVQLVLTLRPASYPDVTNIPSFPSNQNSQMTGSTEMQTNQDIPIFSVNEILVTPIGPEQDRDRPWANQNISSTAEDQPQVVTNDPPEDEDESTDSEELLVPGRRRASLSDIRCLSDIEALSVRQLKEILARNFVNYKGCCEKWELMERVTRLYHDQRDLQQKVTMGEEGKGGPAADENLCKVCMDSPIDCVLLECGHMVTCTKCGMRMSECPICRQYVVRAVHVFRS
ncbi:E3 ubiquitin-protein ligase rififylin isoform X3 [Ranitomeya variabilis]|uniref:E3 ubiquitin-protein ligase rififylin isoform X3 n=1 Tax=Ranitomeya variabilis TaxID=490064 RepID=UPI004057AB87